MKFKLGLGVAMGEMRDDGKYMLGSLGEGSAVKTKEQNNARYHKMSVNFCQTLPTRNRRFLI